MRKLIVLGLAVLCLLSSCTKDEEVKKVLQAIKLTAPADKATVTEKTVKLTWEKSTDATAVYDVYFGTKAELAEADLKAKDIAENVLEVKELSGNTTYFWKVIVKNDNNEAVESEIFSFAIGNSLPTKPELTFPANDAKLMKTELNLLWTESTDADGDAVVYDVYFSKKEEFTADDAQKDFSGTKITLQNLDVNTKYFWKVVAKDTNGGIVEGDVFNFTTHVVPNAQLLTPIDEYKGDMPEKFTWEVQEGFKYIVVCGKTKGFSAADVVAKELTVGECPMPVEKLESNVQYFWQVVAVNAAGTQFSSPIFSFTAIKEIAGPKYGTFTDTRDGHEYKTVEINGKVWLAENFAFVPDADINFLWMIPGENPKVLVDGKKVDNPAYANVKENANYKKYGILYTVEAAKDALPDGWHIATDEEWVDMELYVGMAEADKDLSNYRGSHAKTLKKEDGGWGQEATNESGFGAVPAGIGEPDWSNYPKPKATNLDMKAYFWTGTVKSSSNYYRMLINDDSQDQFKGVKKGLMSSTRRMSVRLVKD